MKIGVLTLPFNLNYGGYLQSYALMTILKQLGHNPILLYYRWPKRPFKKRFVYFFKSIGKLILQFKYRTFVMNAELEYRRSGKLIMNFVDSEIYPKTAPIYSSKELRFKTNQLKLDAIIVGSDQVWRPAYVPSIENYFLSFLSDNDNKLRISYAASFGTISPEYNKKQIEQCRKLYSKFNYISVREESAIDVIKSFNWESYNKVEVVLDPTMLLKKEEYEKFINKTYDKNYIFKYVLDNNTYIEESCIKMSELLNISNIKDCKPIGQYKISIEDWLSNIYNASYIITDSFHGTVFSILFNKPFILIINSDRGKDRFDTILKRFGLKSRVLLNNNIEDIIKNKIDWELINQILDRERVQSLQFLKQSLL